MKWYQTILSFLAGCFCANVIPHFISGILGNPFPSPFANPPGKGLSAPIINILWAYFNILMGYLFIKWGKVSKEKRLSVILFIIGFLLMGINLSLTFSNKLPQ
jgi:hypothetical protein